MFLNQCAAAKQATAFVTMRQLAEQKRQPGAGGTASSKLTKGVNVPKSKIPVLKKPPTINRNLFNKKSTLRFKNVSAKTRTRPSNISIISSSGLSLLAILQKNQVYPRRLKKGLQSWVGVQDDQNASSTCDRVVLIDMSWAWIKQDDDMRSAFERALGYHLSDDKDFIHNLFDWLDTLVSFLGPQLDMMEDEAHEMGLSARQEIGLTNDMITNLGKSVSAYSVLIASKVLRVLAYYPKLRTHKYRVTTI